MRCASFSRCVVCRTIYARPIGTSDKGEEERDPVPTCKADILLFLRTRETRSLNECECVAKHRTYPIRIEQRQQQQVAAKLVSSSVRRHTDTHGCTHVCECVACVSAVDRAGVNTRENQPSRLFLRYSVVRRQICLRSAVASHCTIVPLSFPRPPAPIISLTG